MAQVGWKGRTGAELRGRAQERDRTEVKVRNRMGVGGGGGGAWETAIGRKGRIVTGLRRREHGKRTGWTGREKQYWGTVAWEAGRTEGEERSRMKGKGQRKR